MGPAIPFILLAGLSALVSGLIFLAVVAAIQFFPIENKAHWRVIAGGATLVLFGVLAAAPVVAFFVVGVWDAPN